jgi:hypothetical protein
MGFWKNSNTFSNLSGDQPASKLDTNFSELAIAPLYASGVSGVNTITLTVSLDTTGGYQAGMSFIFTASSNNTGPVTITVTGPSGVYTATPINVVKNNNQALVANDMVAAQAYQIYYDGSNFHLLNPTVVNPATQNKIINSGMEIDQRFEGGSIAPSSGDYLLDRWYVQYVTNSGVIGNQQSTLAPSGYNHSLLTTVTTADTNITAGEYVALGQKIEGYNIIDFVGNTFTLGFWVYASITGTFCVAFRNATPNASYVGTYSINTINTWEYKTITITGGLPSAYTWNKTNGIGLYVNWTLAVGSTFQTTAGSWVTTGTGNYLGTSAQTNFMATNGNQFRLTGVQLSLGSVLPQAEARQFGTELTLCQRYYQKSFNTGGSGIGTAPAQNAGNAGAKGLIQAVGSASVMGGNHIQFATTMRAVPNTLTSYNPSAANAFAYNTSTGTSWTVTNFAYAGTSGVIVGGTTPAGSAAGQTNYVHWTAEAEL